MTANKNYKKLTRDKSNILATAWATFNY